MNDFTHVIHNIKRVPGDLVDAMRSLPTATISEAYGSKGALDHHVKPLRPEMKLCGTVVPVKARPGDNLLAHKALYVARPGDVLLIDTCSFVEGGFWGGIMTEAARKQGIAGLVTDGAVRDTEEIAAMGFPVFCQAVSIKGTTKTSLGTINHPIHFGGIQIYPGDLICGDADGIVVIGREDVAEVLKRAQEREEKERKICEEIKAGKTTLELYGFTEILEREGMKEEEVQ